jgi:hypothetical protein
VTASRQLFILLALLLVAANYPEAEIDTATAPRYVTFVPKAYEEIRIGMTRRQVLELLGCPPLAHVTNRDRSSTALCDSRTCTIDSSWFEAKTTSKQISEVRPNGDLWRSRTWQIWVVFDERNRVRGMMSERPRTPADAKTLAP